MRKRSQAIFFPCQTDSLRELGPCPAFQGGGAALGSLVRTFVFRNVLFLSSLTQLPLGAGDNEGLPPPREGRTGLGRGRRLRGETRGRVHRGRFRALTAADGAPGGLPGPGSPSRPSHPTRHLFLPRPFPSGHSESVRAACPPVLVALLGAWVPLGRVWGGSVDRALHPSPALPRRGAGGSRRGLPVGPACHR